MEERTLGEFIRNLNSNLKKIFRNYERISYRIINTTYAIKFNKINMHQTDKNEFIRNLSQESKPYFRLFERFSMKVIDFEKAINFNNNCLRERLCPKGI